MQTCSTQLWIRVVRRKSDSLNIWFCVLYGEQVCSAPYTVHTIYTLHHLRISYSILAVHDLLCPDFTMQLMLCTVYINVHIQYYTLGECISNFSNSHGEQSSTLGSFISGGSGGSYLLTSKIHSQAPREK